jgi:hypothetical protein
VKNEFLLAQLRFGSHLIEYNKGRHDVNT